MSEKPTREQVLAEPAGERLDAWVCEFVLGWKWSLGMYGDCRFLDDPENPLIEPATPATGDEPECSRGKLHALPTCSTTWESAGLVVETLQRRDWDFVLDNFGNRNQWRCHVGQGGEEGVSAYTESESAPEAICKAALLVALNL